MHVDRSHRVVVRTALLARVEAGRPALISVVAPAGFGKTTFVRQLLDKHGVVAVCDCAGVRSAVDVVRRVIPALADEMPDRAANLSQSETMVGDGPGSGEDSVAIALGAWRVRTRPAVFVFENAEHALADGESRDLLARLLASRPPDRTIVVCSREPLRMHLSRFAPPHHVLTVRADDLAFTREEIADICSDAGVSEDGVDQIAAVSRGWPIAVLLLVRFAREGRLDTLLRRLDDVAFEELHEYLADEVIAALPPSLLDALIASARIPHATTRDITLALGDRSAVDDFVAFERSSPLVARSAEGCYEVHPFIAAMLVERFPHRVDELLGAAGSAYEHAGEYQRAAEVYRARDDQEAAARVLNAIEVIEDHAPDLAYALVLASLDRSVVLRYPRLWAVTALLRTFSADSHALLEEAEELWSGLAPDTAPIVRVYIFVFRTLFRSYVGLFSEALELVEAFRAAIAAPETPSTRMHAWLLYLRSLMTARMGRLSEARRDLEAALPLVHSMHVMAAGTLLTLAADIERPLGNREEERVLTERALATVRKTNMSNFIAFYLAEATFGAWLAGDDPEFTQYAFALEAEVTRERIGGFAFFSACARGHAAVPGAVDLLKWVSCGHLIAAANAPDLERARTHARAAHASAARFHSPFTETLTLLAIASTAEGDERRQAFERAVETAAQVDAPALHAAVAAAARGETNAGFLTSFLRRLDRTVPRTEGTVVIEFTSGKVRRNETELELREREAALLFALAMRPDPLARERLTDMLWPDLDEDAARNAFHVCLHRLKARLGDEGTIVRTREGYRLRTDLRVDLWEIDRAMTGLRAGGDGGADRAHRLAYLYERLRAARAPRTEHWEWFEPIERHLRELRCEVAQMLAGDALAAGRTSEAIALCQEMIAYDPCDEPAREIAISAYLALGDRAAALRHFRQYRETLMAELQCEPSPAIARLIGDDVLTRA